MPDIGKGFLILIKIREISLCGPCLIGNTNTFGIYILKS